MKMRHKKKRFFLIPFAVLAIVGLMGGVVMLLWNSVLPGLVNVNQITFWKAIGLLVLCRILFGGFRPGGPGGFRRGRHKFMNLTDEERENFKSEWQKRSMGFQRKED